MSAAAHALKNDAYFGHARVEIEPLLPAHAARVLEIGCGTGATLGWLKSAGRCDRTVGIELVERVAQVARRHADRIVTGDADCVLDAALSEGPFDLVLCLDVLEHMEDPWRFIARLADALPTGALVVASVPNVRHWRVSVPLLLLGRWRYAQEGVLDRTHLRFFTRESVPQLFDPARFEMAAVRGSHPPAGTRGWWADTLTLGALGDLLAVQYLVAARRR